MFGKFMNNYYYGKSGKGDYTKDDLPTNRWQLFWEMLKIRLSSLVRLNLMYVVIWLPTLIVVLYNILRAYSGLMNITEMQATQTAAEFAQTQATFFSGVQALAMRTLLLLIPCIAVTGPFTAGVAYITRNWARDEHAFIWSDFKDAVKENWKQGLAVSCITSVLPFVVYICWTFYGQMAAQSALYLAPQVLSLMIALLWMMSLMYTYPLMVTYKLRFRDLLRISFILCVGRLPMTIGLKLLSLVPAGIAILVSYFTPYLQWALLIYFVYYVLIGFTLSRFVGASYANAAFDRYINPNIEGAEVDRGLYKEDEYDNPADTQTDFEEERRRFVGEDDKEKQE